MDGNQLGAIVLNRAKDTLEYEEKHRLHFLQRFIDEKLDK